MESHFLHRGACDEFWFANGGRKTPAAVAEEARRIATLFFAQ